jgi:mono/diheme cytochrome c family protein
MIVALTSGVKALIFVLFLVLIPTVPVTVLLVRAMRGSRQGTATGDLVSGHAASTPFRLISIIGCMIAIAVFAALAIVLGAQALADSDEGESVAPVENGGAGSPPAETIVSPVPEQGNATAGKAVFIASGCGECHTLRAASATGTRGPSLDEDEPEFSTVVGCVTTGPGDMPSFAGRLSNAEIRNVAKFVALTAHGQ